MPLQNSAIFENNAAEHRLYVDTNSQGEGAIGNDAFICTPHNPLMQLIMNIALNNNYSDGLRSFVDPRGGEIYTNFEPNSTLNAYFMDDYEYRRTFTPAQTGPDVVKNVVREISSGALITTQEYQVHSLNQHTLRTIGENNRNWLSATISPDFSDFDQVISCAIASILFEVQKFRILRLPEYIQRCYYFSEKEEFDNSIIDATQKLMQALSNHQINFQNVQAMQWNYYYHGVLLTFASNHNINYFEASGLFPNEKNKFDLLPELVDSATNKSEPDNNSARVQYYLQYLKDGIAYLHDNLEAEGFSKILKYFQSVNETLNQLILKGIELSESDRLSVTDCREQLAEFSGKVRLPVIESPENGGSSLFWKSRPREEQHRSKHCAIN